MGGREGERGEEEEGKEKVDEKRKDKEDDKRRRKTCFHQWKNVNLSENDEAKAGV